jgi:hypothetical protein
VWFRWKALELADSLKAAAPRVITEQIGPFDSSMSLWKLAAKVIILHG